tara:strand:- start:1144 stop:1710 length:567 start_codon:yes stop_codon:yes gene_type:complete
MKNNKIWDYKSKESKGEICDALGELVEKKGNSIVMTKATMAKYLIDRITWKPGELVCEPCKGDGAFYDNLPDYVIKSWYEINEGRDYLGTERMSVNTTISNPPFVPRKLFWNFMVRAMETTTDRIFWLINISSLNVLTKNRLNEMGSKLWFIQNLHIVSDKRWFGRYCMMELGRTDKGFITHRNDSSF